MSRRFVSTLATWGGDSSTGGSPLGWPPTRTPRALAAGDAAEMASETRSDSDTRSTCNRSAPAWITENSNSSSTSRASRSDSTLKVVQ